MVADAYEIYLKAEGIPPLERTALGVQLFREDREPEFLIELPERIQIHRILVDREGLR
ncbi:hypothetical protein NKH19_15600 [Mesorhizobium sp. M1338]|uniref:hypothetical protein n=1 Tax=unclassified Mesorhizobium TaxID=325217 RepID=UPI003336DBA1